MSPISSWQLALVNSWQQVWYALTAILPKILGAIIVFFIGLIVAAWTKKGLSKLFELIKLDVASQKAGIESFLKKAGLKLTFAGLLATLVRWLIILVFFLAAVDLLGLAVVSQVLIGILGYLPNILAAALIVGAGYFVGGLVEGLVKGALASVDHELAKPLAKVARWLIVVSAVFAAIDQLKIAQGLVNTFFQGLTYTLVLAIGLSVGLGAKDLVSKILHDWYEKVKK